MKRKADVVLIDSRTGVTEMGGVCTYQLADMVLMFCSAAKQCIHGTDMMAKDFNRPKIKKWRQGRVLDLLIIPARVEEEGDFEDRFYNQFIQHFSCFFPEKLKDNPKKIWKLKIPYKAYYAFEERVAVREVDDPKKVSADTMIAAFKEIVSVMSDSLIISGATDELIVGARDREQYTFSKEFENTLDIHKSQNSNTQEIDYSSFSIQV
ncbi:MAG: hypothetical protein GY862_04445 [Gammaproteobacteria bacterium]|nr:hypothetical protein [Gammaproteobacteria bacterium]